MRKRIEDPILSKGVDSKKIISANNIGEVNPTVKGTIGISKVIIVANRDKLATVDEVDMDSKEDVLPNLNQENPVVEGRIGIGFPVYINPVVVDEDIERTVGISNAVLDGKKDDPIKVDVIAVAETAT